jgi:hypothetical protein
MMKDQEFGDVRLLKSSKMKPLIVPHLNQEFSLVKLLNQTNVLQKPYATIHSDQKGPAPLPS